MGGAFTDGRDTGSVGTDTVCLIAAGCPRTTDQIADNRRCVFGNGVGIVHGHRCVVVDKHVEQAIHFTAIAIDNGIGRIEVEIVLSACIRMLQCLVQRNLIAAACQVGKGDGDNWLGSTGTVTRHPRDSATIGA